MPFPLRGTSFGSFAPAPVPLFFLQSEGSQAGWQGGDIMECIRCQGLMVGDDFFDLQGTQDFMWMKGWRCMNCGHAVDPLIEANRRSHEATIRMRLCEEPDKEKRMCLVRPTPPDGLPRDAYDGGRSGRSFVDT